jgi:hypothetical protein
LQQNNKNSFHIAESCQQDGKKSRIYIKKEKEKEKKREREGKQEIGESGKQET